MEKFLSDYVYKDLDPMLPAQEIQESIFKSAVEFLKNHEEFNMRFISLVKWLESPYVYLSYPIDVPIMRLLINIGYNVIDEKNFLDVSSTK